MRRLFPFLALCLVFSVGCTKVDSVVTENLLHNGGDYWELLTVDGKPIGFQQTVLSNEEIQGRPVFRFEKQSRMTVLRHGSRFDVALSLRSFSDPDGSFLTSQASLKGGGEPIETQCRAEGDRLSVFGTKNSTEMPWTPKTRGPGAVIRELLAKPMTPGQKRTLRFFDPVLLRNVEATLFAERIESLSWNGVPRNLLRISVKNAFSAPDASAKSQFFSEIHWVDAGGNILQNEMTIGSRKILATRTDRDRALAVVEAEPAVELGGLGVVPLDRPIKQPRNVFRVSFLVRTKIGSPADRFPATPFQSIETLDDRTAKITVWSAVSDDPTSVGNVDFRKSRVEANAEDLASSRLIESDDPQLQALAATVDSSTSTPWQTATALEKLVHDTILQTTFSVAFAPSSEVLKSRTGDCTEFAVLLAALCRAKKIPARVTLGLVYAPLAPAPSTGENVATDGLVFHLWNEVFIDGVWRPLDATFALGGADAARIKIADAALGEDSPAPLTRSLLDLIGQLEVNLADR